MVNLIHFTVTCKECGSTDCTVGVTANWGSFGRTECIIVGAICKKCNPHREETILSTRVIGKGSLGYTNGERVK